MRRSSGNSGKAKFGHKFVLTPASELKLNSRLNRRVSPARKKHFVAHMNLDKLGALAAWRDGQNLWLIDGQHRKLALEELGLDDIKVNVEIVEGATFEEACDIFLGRNDGLAVRAFDKFDKGVKAGYEDCIETKRIIERFGVAVSDQAADGKLACVAAARDIYNKDHGEALTGALELAINAWGMTATALDGAVVRGLGEFCAHYNGEVDRGALIKKLSRHQGGPGALIGQAKGQRELKGGTVGRNLALIVVDLYNKGRQKGQLAPL